MKVHMERLIILMGHILVEVGAESSSHMIAADWCAMVLVGGPDAQIIHS